MCLVPCGVLLAFPQDFHAQMPRVSRCPRCVSLHVVSAPGNWRSVAITSGRWAQMLQKPDASATPEELTTCETPEELADWWEECGPNGNLNHLRVGRFAD